MKKLVIFGTGSFAEVAYFYFTHDSDYQVVGFTEHAKYNDKANIFDLPVVPYENLSETYPPDRCDLFIAVGHKDINKIRADLYDQTKNLGYQLVSYVSSKCTIWTKDIGDNCFIFEDNTIQPFVKIGNNVVLWSGNHIGHHSIIEDHCFISSHVVISGNVTVKSHSFIGVNATLSDGITIGKSNIIGAGSLIMDSTEDNELYIEQRTNAANRTSEGII